MYSKERVQEVLEANYRVHHELSRISRASGDFATMKLADYTMEVVANIAKMLGLTLRLEIPPQNK